MIRFYTVLLFLITIFTTAQSNASDETIAEINLATVNWEPHYGEKMLNQGYFTEITREVFRRAGYKMHIAFVPWKRALTLGKQGRYDGVLGAYYTKERARDFLYSNQVHQAQVVLISLREKNIEYDNLQDLISYRIGYLRGGSGGALFDNADFLTKVPVDNQRLNIEKLLNSRIDLIMTAKLHGLSILKERFATRWRDQFIIHAPPLQSSDLHLMISKKIKGGEKIIREFNQQLKALREDGSFQNILTKHGLSISN